MGLQFIAHPPNKSEFEGVQDALLPWKVPSVELFQTFQPLATIPTALTKHFRTNRAFYHPPILVRGYPVEWSEDLAKKAIDSFNVALEPVYGTKTEWVVAVERIGGINNYQISGEALERVEKEFGCGQELLWYIVQSRPGWRRVARNGQR
ncbi:hypothetical protein AX16_002232 [Volvariella volvacea WC 439]|nr:hypothetical protein AX16_002232 [Volvariella volvacea WC 439]